jgi:iron complex outermembrane receptor protein
MIDGRSVYTPLFSGVFWDVQNTLLEDIDRIEVVRGPGGTLWGANAVNGVINIITKETAQTQGWFAEAGAGTEEHGFTALRFGGSHENFDYRGYGRFFNRDAYVFADGSDGADGWHMLHGGFRLDWNPGADDDLALSGELYEGEAGLTVLDRSTLSPIETMSDTSGGHVQAGWRHRLAGGSTTDLNVYYDRTRRTQFDNETRDTFDIDFHQVWPAHPRHGIVWGAGYRVTASSGLNPAQFAEGGRTLNLYSGFVQDQIALSAGWSLIVGAKVEHNDFTGFELQPSIRTLWTSDDRYAVWGAVSRAVRTPSEGETDASIQLSGGTDPITGLPIVLVFEGNPDLDTEKLVAYEAGFRAQPRPWFSLDAATFFNTYSDLSEATAGEPMVQLVPPPPRILLPIAGANVGSAETYGVELSSRWQAHPRVRVGLSYSYLEIELTDFAQFDQFDDAGASPHHQLKLSSNADLAYDVELDAYLYFVGRLDALDVDRYTRFDLRLGWRPTPAWEVAVVGQNLFQAEHLEFASSLAGEVPTQVQRSVYGMVQWRH